METEIGSTAYVCTHGQAFGLKILPKNMKAHVACCCALTERTNTQLIPGSGIIHATHAAHVAARRMPTPDACCGATEADRCRDGERKGCTWTNSRCQQWRATDYPRMPQCGVTSAGKSPGRRCVSLDARSLSFMYALLVLPWARGLLRFLSNKECGGTVFPRFSQSLTIDEDPISTRCLPFSPLLCWPCTGCSLGRWMFARAGLRGIISRRIRRHGVAADTRPASQQPQVPPYDRFPEVSRPYPKHGKNVT